VKGAPGSVTAVGPESIFISAQGGQVEVFKLRHGDGKKIPAPQWFQEAGLTPGTVLGD
jgi:methionyl-tRNA formyltransferase